MLLAPWNNTGIQISKISKVLAFPGSNQMEYRMIHIVWRRDAQYCFLLIASFQNSILILPIFRYLYCNICLHLIVENTFSPVLEIIWYCALSITMVNWQIQRHTILKLHRQWFISCSWSIIWHDTSYQQKCSIMLCISKLEAVLRKLS